MRHTSQSITIPVYVTDDVDGGPDARNNLYFLSQMQPYSNVEYRSISSIPLNIQIKDAGVGYLDLAVYSNTTYAVAPRTTQSLVTLSAGDEIVPDRDVTIKSSSINYTSWFNVQKIVSSSITFTTYDYTSGLNANGVIGQLYPPVVPTVVDPYIGSISNDVKTGQLEIKIGRAVTVNGSDLVAPFAIAEVPLNDDGTPAKPGKQVIIR